MAGGAKKGDPRHIVLCCDVEARVFGGGADGGVMMEGRKKEKKKKRGGEDKGEWRSVDMEERLTMSDTYESQDYGYGDEGVSDKDEDEVAGVRIHLPPLPSSSHSRSPSTAYPRRSSAPSLHINDENHNPNPATLALQRLGQQRAEQREQVRQAARRGCAFGFLVGDREGEGGRRRTEAVQDGRVVEGSFAKGEWGVRWRE